MRRGALPFALLAMLSGACASRCSSEEELAELTTISGPQVDRDRAGSVGKWQLAALGERFGMGDGLRTGRTSSAELTLLPSGSAHVEPRTVLRFLASAPEARQVSVETGAITIVAQNIDIEVHTPRAVAKIPRGSKLKLSTQDGRELFDVLVGRVMVAHEGVERSVERAAPLEIAPSAETSAADAEAADAAIPPPPPPAAESAANAAAPGPTVPDGAAPARPSADPSAAESELAPKRRDLSLPELESATIHVARPPLAVFVPTTPCAERERVSVDGESLALHEGGGVVQLNAGAHTIRVQCGGGTTRLARVRVVRDAAKMDLPKRAQNVRVEADGRRYTVRYQNLLPVVTFAWPGSHAGKLALVVRKGARESSYDAERAEVALASGTLGEGEYKFLFRQSGGNDSPVSTLRLTFDNTARSAYLSAPGDGVSAQGGSIEVAGAALTRSRVRVQGQPVELDEKGRFRTEVPVAPDEDAISVRVEHPESGVHYYVRRLR